MPLHLLAIRIERFFLQQELHAPRRKLLRMLGDLLLQRRDQLLVHVAQVLQRDRLTADTTQARELVHELPDLLEQPGLNLADERVRHRGNAFHLGLRVPLDADDLLIFIDRAGRRLFDGRQRRLELERLFVIQPEIRIEQVIDALHHVHIEPRVAVFLVQQREHLVTLGHAPHDGRVAQLEEITVLALRHRQVAVQIRRLPHLDDVMLLRFVTRFEQDQLAILERSEAVANDRRLDLLLNQVVWHQHVDAVHPVVERVQHVLAVRRLDTPLKLHLHQR